ncbi:MAG: 1,2-phenylacetyl-CoA epoxidase subunit PaaE [Pseudomonadota bacterium]
MSGFHTLTVDKVRRETPDAVCVSLLVPDALSSTFAFHPGQYLTLRAVLDGEDVRRPYSICSTPDDPLLSVGIKAVPHGLFSTYANTMLRAGDTVEVMQPFGHFGFAPDASNARHYALFAAGSGITPVLSIAASVLATESESRVSLFYGNRDTSSVMFRDALADLKDRHLERFNVTHVLSREPQDVALHAGRLDGDKVRELIDRGHLDPAHVHSAYLCGPGAFIDELEAALVEANLSPDHIHHERFATDKQEAAREHADAGAVAPRDAVQAGCEVTVHLDGASRVFSLDSGDASLLDAARRQGIELPWSCKGGMCCTCRCKQLGGDASMRANFSLEPWEVDAGFVLACQLEPTSKRLELDFDAS